MKKFLKTRMSLLAAAGLCFVAGVAAAPKQDEPIAVDHHLHVNSPAIMKFMPNLCNSPKIPMGCPREFVATHTVKELLADMDAAGVKRGVLLSTGYMAETSFVDPMVKGHAAIVHAGNVFTVAAARAHPDRLVAFIGVNPLTTTALPEIARWKGNRFVTGLKLHLTNSGVDLRQPDQVARLAAVFAAAARNHLAIVIHMRTMRKDYGAEDVQIFLRDVLPAAQGSTVQIAHAAGWSGLDVNTLDALGAFADAIDANPALRQHLYFDLAAVWNVDSSVADKEKLVGLMRRIGIRQFLPGSDWPDRIDLVNYYGKVYPGLPLTAAEWTTIRSNIAPYMPAKR